MTQLALSDVHEEITTGFSTLTGSMEASERNIALTIKDNIEEIRTWGARHSDNMENLSTRLLHYRLLDKEVFIRGWYGIYRSSALVSQYLQVWDIIPGDIHIIKQATHSIRCYRTNITYKDSYCTVENSNTQKIIREYQVHGNNREDAMDMEVSEHYPVRSVKVTCFVFQRLDRVINFFIKAKSGFSISVY